MYTRLTRKAALDRRTRQLLPGRGGCARGQTFCGLDAKRQTAVSRVNETASEPLTAVAEREDQITVTV